MLVHRGGSRDLRDPHLDGTRGKSLASTRRSNLSTPLTWLVATHAASIMQARFCGAALQEKQQKPQCVWQHLCSADRSELLEGSDRSTSELTVADCVGDRLGKLYGRMRHRHGYKRGMADASTSRVRGRHLDSGPSFAIIYFPAGPVGPYSMSCERLF